MRIVLTLIMLLSIAYSQNAGNILTSRNYVFGTRPTYIPMLQGDGIQIYKTSVDSLSVDYALVKNKPTIPTNTNQLTNGNGFINKTQGDSYYKPIAYVPTWDEITGKPTFFSGSYNDLTNKPTIPKVYSTWGSIVSNGNVTFNISSAGFTSLTQAGCYIRINDSSGTYSYQITDFSQTSVTVNIKKLTTTGVEVLAITVIGSITWNNVANGTTVYAQFIGN